MMKHMESDVRQDRGGNIYILSENILSRMGFRRRELLVKLDMPYSNNLCN